MKKRLISLILAIMALVIVAVVGCSYIDELNAYKEQSIAEVANYAQSKGKDNYYTYNWDVIERILKESSNSIRKKLLNITIDSVVSEAKNKIDQIRTKEQEDNGDFGPDPTNEEDLKYRALQWYAYRYIKLKDCKDLTMEECMKKVRFYTGYSKYFGCYNGCIVASFYLYGYDVVPAAGDPYYIEGYEFRDPYRNIPIKVYKEGEFYLLTEAYEQGLLTKNDIKALVEYGRKIREGKTNEK